MAKKHTLSVSNSDGLISPSADTENPNQYENYFTLSPDDKPEDQKLLEK